VRACSVGGEAIGEAFDSPPQAAEAESSCESPVFDKAEFRSMFERMGSDGAVIASMFLESTPLKLNEMESAIGRADASGLRSIAHSLVSTASIVGAAGLSAACRELELIAVSAEELTGAAEEFAKARSSYEAAKAAIEDFLSDPSR